MSVVALLKESPAGAGPRTQSAGLYSFGQIEFLSATFRAAKCTPPVCGVQWRCVRLKVAGIDFCAAGATYIFHFAYWFVGHDEAPLAVV